ncbi:MAG: membrane protein FxsA [Mesorhizobium sp.]|nr:FxsA family protein [Mesorhizobium sp.]MCO5161470.1 membrane protein FxsA [Mesorhizobium sp.]
MTRAILGIFFLLLPLLEIAGFVVVGSRIGALATVGLVIASALLGVVLLRIQGLGALRRAQALTQAGGTPDREIVHGAMIVLAGLLLIVPGFITDVFGLLLFLPPVRDLAWNAFRARIVVVGTGFGMRSGKARREAKVIDLDEQDYREIDGNGPSPWRRQDPE